jgi:hypothetical protein
MRYRILMLVWLFCGHVSPAQENIRQVDFKNFIYPLSGQLLGHHGLEWLGIPEHTAAKRSPIHLVNGSNLTKASSFVMDGTEYAQYEGFTMQSVTFADLTGDGNDEAIVVLHYQTGGTQNTDYVYVYTLEQHRPKLLAYCHTGDRAYFGLKTVYAEGGALVFELFDPKRASGDCCSSGIVVFRYKWQGGRFELIGAVERRKLNTNTK